MPFSLFLALKYLKPKRSVTSVITCVSILGVLLGVAVVIEAMHTCMSMRGVQKSNAITTTSAFSGIFLKSDKTRNEFLELISSKRL